MSRATTWPNRSYVISAWLALAAALALLAIDFILLLLHVRLFAVWLTVYFAAILMFGVAFCFGFAGISGETEPRERLLLFSAQGLALGAMLVCIALYALGFLSFAYVGL